MAVLWSIRGGDSIWVAVEIPLKYTLTACFYQVLWVIEFPLLTIDKNSKIVTILIS
jgi:hypothetical protein